MCKFIKLRQAWISNKTISYDYVIVNIDHIVCAEEDAIQAKAHPAVLEHLNIDAREFDSVIDEVKVTLITLVSGKQIRVTEKLTDIETILISKNLMNG